MLQQPQEAPTARPHPSVAPAPEVSSWAILGGLTGAGAVAAWTRVPTDVPHVENIRLVIRGGIVFVIPDHVQLTASSLYICAVIRPV